MQPNRAEYDIIVIGGGHAGLEAAWASAAAGAQVALITLDASKIGVMSCNPAIGGLAKGQMVREIDALGGLMGLVADATGIMFKVLNTSKGAAVRGPRAQCDKHAYAREAQRLIASRTNIHVIEGAVERLLVDQSASVRRVRGVDVALADGTQRSLRARSVVLTTGTFMRGLMHTGEQRSAGGRIGEAPATAISEALQALGFEMGRLKTGTPPRLRRSTIDWESLEPQYGDDPCTPFSDLTDRSRFPSLAQVECRITRTTAEVHGAIRANLHRAPMYSGQIESVGPRYCPSIEDKVVRFADRESHHVFLEPESHESDWIYCNGVSTSLPRDVQELIVRGMPGCGNAEILQHGYAVEYDMVRPHQIDATAMTKSVEGLFLAGQINGTSGYEEAAGQGLIAGLNAARFAADQTLVALGRDQAYIGVMMDDLVTRTPREPYRMFTSRAEHRLLLRSDNAADRLTPLGRQWGTVCDDRWGRFETRAAGIARLNTVIDSARVGSRPMREWIKAPDVTAADLKQALSQSPESWNALALSDGVLETVLAERQYEGYIKRHRAEARRQSEMERRRIPASLDFTLVHGLRTEAREAMARFKPSTVGQAGRLEGVTPADLTLVLVAMSRHRDGAAPSIA